MNISAKKFAILTSSSRSKFASTVTAEQVVRRRGTRVRSLGDVVGEGVIVDFNNIEYKGSITESWKDTKSGKWQYHVVYEDGDEEDLDIDPCRKAISRFKKAEGIVDEEESDCQESSEEWMNDD